MARRINHILHLLADINRITSSDLVDQARMNPKVRLLFKQLLYMGKDYPIESGGYSKFSNSLKGAFRKTPVNSEEDLTQALKKGEYIIKGMSINKNCINCLLTAELEALYFLRRYRHLKRTYYND